MALVKCPRCELNYMQDTEKLCTVCRSEMRGSEPSRDDIADLCIECGENAAAPGDDLCYFCIKQIKQQEGLRAGVAGVGLGLEADDVIDEIVVDAVEEDLPEEEFSDDVVADEEEPELDDEMLEEPPDDEEDAIESLDVLEEEEYERDSQLDDE